MLKSIVVACSLILVAGTLNAQMVMDKNSPAYNLPYDTLIRDGLKAIESGKTLGIKTPALGMMFYNRAIEINKTRPEAYLYKADAYRAYNQLDEALENLTLCLEVSPDNPECMYGMFYTSFLGSKQYKLEDVPKQMMTQIYNSAKAFLAIAPATGMSQQKADARIIGSSFKLLIDNKDLFIKYNTNNIDESTPQNIAVLEQILPGVIATDNPVIVCGIYDNLTGYYFVNGDYVKVKDYANKAIATGEAYTSTYYYLAYTLYNQDKNAAEAERICDLGIKRGNFNKTTNLRLNILYSEGKKAYVAKDYAKASVNFQKYTVTRPESERASAYLGFSNFSLKKYPDASKALKVLKKFAEPATVKIYYPNLDALIAFADKPTAVVPAVQTTLVEVEKQEEIMDKGIDQYYDKKQQESIATLNSVLPYFEQTKNPVNTSLILANLGYNYHSLKEYAKAQEYYRKSIDAGAYESTSYNNLGLLLYGVDGNYAEAEKVLRAGIAKYPKDEDISGRLAKMFINRADAAYDKKDYTAAIADYDKALEFGDNSEVYAFLGFSYYFTQQKDKAKDAMEYAKFLNPKITETYPAIDQVLDAVK